MRVSDRLADRYFDNGLGSYGDCYAQVAWEIKERATNWRRIRKQNRRK